MKQTEEEINALYGIVRDRNKEIHDMHAKITYFEKLVSDLTIQADNAREDGAREMAEIACSYVDVMWDVPELMQLWKNKVR